MIIERMFEKILKITEANTRIGELSEQVSGLEAANDAACQKINEQLKQIDASKEIISERTEQLEQANARIAQLESEFVAADEKALEIVAELGIKSPVKETEASDSKTTSELWEEYHSFQNNFEKQEFYKTHKEQLLKG